MMKGSVEAQVEAATLLNDVEALVRRYVVLSLEESAAVTLWCVHTHAVEALGVTPYLAVTSAEKGSGKTQLLEVLELLVARPWPTGSVSAATLARKIDVERPTLLLDESDAAFKGDLEFPRFGGHLLTEFAQSGRMSVDAKDPAVFSGVPLGSCEAVAEQRSFGPAARSGARGLAAVVAELVGPARRRRGQDRGAQLGRA